MALGVDHQWAQQFAGITEEWPEWLVVARGEGIDPARWMGSLGSMAQQAELVFTAATRTGRYSQPESTPGSITTDKEGRPAI